MPWPRGLRLLVFNPVVSLLVVLTLSQPFVMDFFGAFTIPPGSAEPLPLPRP